MHTVTRRAALAAVPALAATATLPTLASTASASGDPLALSPRFAGLFAQWRTCKETGDNAHAQAKRIEEAAQAREGIVTPEPFNSKEDLPAWDVYFEKVSALSEQGEIARLNKIASEHWHREWAYADDMVALEPKTLGDLAAQIESFIGAATPDNIGDKILLDVPGHIRRLAGRLS